MKLDLNNRKKTALRVTEFNRKNMLKNLLFVIVLLSSNIYAQSKKEKIEQAKKEAETKAFFERAAENDRKEKERQEAAKTAFFKEQKQKEIDKENHRILLEKLRKEAQIESRRLDSINLAAKKREERENDSIQKKFDSDLFYALNKTAKFPFDSIIKMEMLDSISFELSNEGQSIKSERFSAQSDLIFKRTFPEGRIMKIGAINSKHYYSLTSSEKAYVTFIKNQRNIFLIFERGTNSLIHTSDAIIEKMELINPEDKIEITYKIVKFYMKDDPRSRDGYFFEDQFHTKSVNLHCKIISIKTID